MSCFVPIEGIFPSFQTDTCVHPGRCPRKPILFDHEIQNLFSVSIGGLHQLLGKQECTVDQFDMDELEQQVLDGAYDLYVHCETMKTDVRTMIEGVIAAYETRERGH
jgi:hypothetical protein